ncbi:terpenoid synthase [Hygrophoropsis aurantiaca]|uniref:Terpenoid synthase n=1 Tax=Hygrophoropsis aurantiaca TaxID=72124 RepID=A0ACB8A1X8_9AGAM|nr:terpenoid synthase [Hygrophoropsis aurantiaca]
MQVIDSSQFYLPNLFASCPLRKGVIFPGNYVAIGAASKAWINAYDVFTERQRNIFDKTNSELLSARAFPYVSTDKFRTCCDCLNLLWMIDEISDDLNGPGARKTGDLFLNCLRDPNFPDSSPLANLTKDFRIRFVEQLGPRSAKRFMTHAQDYIDAFVIEAELRDKGKILDLASYPTLRRNNSANHISFDFAEFGLEIDLPDELFQDTTFMQIYYAASDMIWWSNDVYSFKMEYGKGHGGSNIVTILMHECGMDLQAASDYVGVEFKKLMERFFEGRKNMRSWGAALDADLERYFDALGQWVIANMEWSFETQRYFGPAFEEVKKTRLVKL